MHDQNLSEAHIRESIAGEEDPGASLDVVRSLIARGQRATPAAGHPPPQIHMDCAEGDQTIAIDVAWQRQRARLAEPTAADLLGLVVAHHGAIANTAWSRFNRTGQRHVALEVDEDEDGVFYVSLKDA